MTLSQFVAEKPCNTGETVKRVHKTLQPIIFKNQRVDRSHDRLPYSTNNQLLSRTTLFFTHSCRLQLCATIHELWLTTKPWREGQGWAWLYSNSVFNYIFLCKLLCSVTACRSYDNRWIKTCSCVSQLMGNRVRKGNWMLCLTKFVGCYRHSVKYLPLNEKSGKMHGHKVEIFKLSALQFLFFTVVITSVNPHSYFPTLHLPALAENRPTTLLFFSSFIFPSFSSSLPPQAGFCVLIHPPLAALKSQCATKCQTIQSWTNPTPPLVG